MGAMFVKTPLILGHFLAHCFWSLLPENIKIESKKFPPVLKSLWSAYTGEFRNELSNEELMNFTFEMPSVMRVVHMFLLW